MSIETMGAVDKAAVLMVLLPPDVSSEILKGMEEAEMKQLTAAMCRLGEIPRDVREAVLAEFNQTLDQASEVTFARPDNIKLMLQNAVGREKAAGIVSSVFRPDSLGFLKTAPADKLAGALRGEHPQTVALVMGQMTSEQAAALLALLPEELRNSALSRSACISQPRAESMEIVGKALEAALSAGDNTGNAAAGRIADILSLSSKAECDAMLSGLLKSDPALAEEVKRKMMTFEKILEMPDAAVQKVLRKLDQRTLARALKGAAQNICEKVYKNMTEEASKAMMEDIETMGEVSQQANEEAQRKIIRTMKSMSESGELSK